jgi:hypothetical protein
MLHHRRRGFFICQASSGNPEWVVILMCSLSSRSTPLECQGKVETGAEGSAFHGNVDRRKDWFQK